MIGASAADIDTVLALEFEGDVFGVYDEDLDSEILERPFHILDRLRQENGPVFRLDEGKLGGVDVARMFALDRSKSIYVALSFNVVQQVLRNPDTFNQGYDTSYRQLMGHVPPVLNPPEHTQYRALINKAFGRMAVERLTEGFIRPVAEGLAKRLREVRSADLVRQYTAPLPFLVIAHIMGLPLDQFPTFARQVRDLMAMGYQPEAGLRASQEMAVLFGDLVEERAAKPTDDLLSALIEAEIDGDRLSKEDVIAFCRLLVPAGMETTTRTLGNLLIGLLSDDRQLDLLRRDPGRIPDAVQEGLRWEGPAILMPKITTEATQLAGVDIPADAYVCVTHGYANRDAARWDHPHEFDLTRKRQSHLAYASGPHACVGNQLANKEMEVALDVLLERLPTMRLDASKPPPQTLGFMMRSPTEIWVEFPELN